MTQWIGKFGSHKEWVILSLTVAFLMTLKLGDTSLNTLHEKLVRYYLASAARQKL